MKSECWTTTIDGIIYTIEYKSKFLKKELLVNKVPVTLQCSNTFGISRETIFYLANTPAIFVNIDNVNNIAINGIYLNSGEKYIEVKNMPHWNFIFLGLLSLIFILSYDSICAILFALLGFYFLIRASIEPSLSEKKRIILCFTITISMHLFYWLVLFLLLSIL
jgi:hypothetical protein